MHCGACGGLYLHRRDGVFQAYTRGPFVGPLYGVIFEREPALSARAMAQRFFHAHGPAEALFLLRSCEAELKAPSCQLHKLYEYEYKLSEADLRAFLGLYARELRHLVGDPEAAAELNEGM